MTPKDEMRVLVGLVFRPQYRGTWLRVLMPLALLGVAILEGVLKRRSR